MSSRLRNHKIKTSTSLLLVMIFEKSFIKLEEDKEQYKESDKFIMPVDIDYFKQIINSDTFLVDLGRIFRAFKESDIQKDFSLRQALADYLNDYKNHRFNSSEIPVREAMSLLQSDDNKEIKGHNLYRELERILTDLHKDSNQSLIEKMRPKIKYLFF